MHVKEKERIPFTSTGLGKRSNRNFCCKVLLNNDSRISAPQSPAGKVSGLGSIIGNRFGRLNCPPGLKHTRYQGRIHATQETPRPPSSFHSCTARSTANRKQFSIGFWRIKQVFRSTNQESDDERGWPVL